MNRPAARERRLGAWILLLGASYACGDGTVFGPSDVEVARATWEAREITDYTYHLTIGCFCLTLPDVVVTVRSGAIVDVVNQETGESVDPSEFDFYYTVSDLFDLATRAREEHAEHLEIEFDPTHSFPSRIEIDWRFNVADDEITITAGDLVVE